MGAYLYFKLEKKEIAIEVNQFLEKLEENKSLGDEGIYFLSTEDVVWAKANNPASVDYYKGKVGTGEIKVSGVECRTNICETDILETQTKVFEILNQKFSMSYYAHSCALSVEEYYFSLEQMKRITNNGKLLSGKTAKDERARELYEIYFNLFSETKFDISLVKENDYLIMDDGKKYRVEKLSHRNCLTLEHSRNCKFSMEEIVNIASNIKEHIKYVPKIRYDGAICDIEAYAVDNNVLVYLELVGSENMVKAISSIIMQGRTKMNDKNIESPDLGYFSVFKAGNKRKITSLDDGLAHAIIYHSPSIVDANFNILIGRDKEELKNSFNSWLELSQPLPYPKQLQNNIYESLKNLEKLEEIKTFGIEAVRVKLSMNESEDDFAGLDEVIIDVCKKAELISEDATPIKADAPLPESKYLTVGQVERIWDTLKSMPKTYELDGLDIKPIGLKLFSPNMTLYITEADLGNEDDEFQNMHTQCYGYIKNENDPQCSEWGYINVPAYLELVYSNGGGFEKDLYFKDMFIDLKGNIGLKKDLL